MGTGRISSPLETAPGSLRCLRATGVVRRAENGEEFLKSVHDVTGFPVSVLSEASEAFLSAKGILSALPSPKALFFDLGGSSTEFLLVDAEKAEPVWSTSVFIGAATLTERYLPGDPPSPVCPRASDAVRSALYPALSHGMYLANSGASSSSVRLVGTAGTVTTLAAMCLEMAVYHPFRVNGRCCATRGSPRPSTTWPVSRSLAPQYSGLGGGAGGHYPGRSFDRA